MINGLSLFSGIGGIDLALSEWVRPVAYCEIERYAAAVLFSRMFDGAIPTAPIFPDVTKLTGKILPSIDIIYGGFPCQDISVAGRGKGLEGERSGLFFEIMRLVDEIRPSFIFLENVPAITTRGLGTVAAEITKRGYDCRWTMLSAAEVGANHKRKRWWLLGYSNSEKRPGLSCGEAKKVSELRGDGSDVENSYSKRLEEQRKPESSIKRQSEFKQSGWWQAEPDVGRVVNELSYRVDRIKCLGNAVVPLQAKEAFKRLMEIK